MNKREYEILRILRNHQSWITAAQLSELLSCSVRSVKTAISNLNGLYPGCVISSRNGYLLGEGTPRLSDAPNSIPETAEERRAFILRKLLMEEPEIDMEQLAGKLFIAFSTLNNELPQLRTFLQKYDLNLQIRKSILRITGSESNKKRALNQLIYDEAKDFFNSVTMLNEYFPDLDLSSIQRIVDDVLLKQHFYLNDYSLSNLLLHIAITIERNRRGFCAEKEDCENRAITMPAHIWSIVDQICSRLSELLEVSFSTIDRYAFCVILYTRCTRQDGPGSEDMLEPSIRRLTIYLFENVKETFDISINDEDFLVRFGLHLENMLIRLDSDIPLRNPQLDLIRTQYPYIYDIAIFIAKTIERKVKVHVSEDEIGYIALHIGGVIEQAGREHTRIHTVLLYPGYYENGIQLLNKLSRTFQDDLMIEELISSPEQLSDFPDCQLLITTLPLRTALSIPCLQITNYLNITDVSAIAEKLEQIKRGQLQDMLEKQLKQLFKPDLFFYSPEYRTPDDFLKHIGNRMESLGYAEECFYQKLKEREQISSSAIGNIAIPHPIDMDARQSAIAVALYPQSLSWGSSQVNIIFTLAIRKEDRKIFRHIFDLVTEIVMEPSHFKALMKVQSYTDFIHVLLSYT